MQTPDQSREKSPGTDPERNKKDGMALYGEGKHSLGSRLMIHVK